MACSREASPLTSLPVTPAPQGQNWGAAGGLGVQTGPKMSLFEARAVRTGQERGGGESGGGWGGGMLSLHGRPYGILKAVIFNEHFRSLFIYFFIWP